MAVSLGCIKTLNEALAYVNAEMPLLTPKGAAAAGPVHQRILDGLDTLTSESANIDAIKRSILDYQCADRTARGLKCRDIAQALSCADGYVMEPATEVGPQAKDTPPVARGAGGVKAASFPLWLAAGLLVGGVAYYAFAGKKSTAKTKGKRRPPRRSRAPRRRRR